MKAYLIAGVVTAAAVSASLAAQAPHNHAPRPELTRAAALALAQDKFAKADANRDGAVIRAEVDAAMAAGKAKRQAAFAERRAERFAALDIDKDGKLSRAEFDAPRPRGPGFDAGRPGGEKRGHGGMHRGGGRFGGAGIGERWFGIADANKDGRVTLAEATAAATARFDKADINRDGKISHDERKAAREHAREAWKAKRG